MDQGTKPKLLLNADQVTFVKEKKNQEFYDNLELTNEDLDKVEKRIAELEEYIGIDPNLELDYFLNNDIEKLDVKCNRLEDFVTVVEDRNFLLSDVFNKTDSLDSFLKSGNKFTSQCIDLGKKSAFVLECQESLQDYSTKLKEMQSVQHFLNFNPIIGKLIFVRFHFYAFYRCRPQTKDLATQETRNDSLTPVDKKSRKHKGTRGAADKLQRDGPANQQPN